MSPRAGCLPTAKPETFGAQIGSTKAHAPGAHSLSLDPIAFKNTKHILRAAEFLRDLAMREAVAMKHLPGRVMIADILTKAPARVVFIDLLRLIDAYAQDGIACPA